VVKYIVEIPAARCIIPWKVAKRCSKDLEEMLAAFAEEWSKKIKNFACQKSDGKSRSQKSDEQKSEVRRKKQKSEVR
jgi:Skp family chaperone for outer membrane proteins